MDENIIFFCGGLAAGIFIGALVCYRAFDLREGSMQKAVDRILAHYRHEFANHLQLFISLTQMQRYDRLLERMKKSDARLKEWVYLHNLCPLPLITSLVRWQEAGVTINVHFSEKPGWLDRADAKIIKSVFSHLLDRYIQLSGDHNYALPAMVWEKKGNLLVTGLTFPRSLLYPLPPLLPKLLRKSTDAVPRSELSFREEGLVCLRLFFLYPSQQLSHNNCSFWSKIKGSIK